MGKQRRNPWNVLLFFLVIVIVAYLCKRGWDGFYDASTGVYCIAEVRSSVDVWSNHYYFDGVWIKNAPPVGNGVYWIWGAPNSGYVSRPIDEAFTFYHSYNNTTGTLIQAKMYGGADNYATVTINGQRLPQITGSLDSPYNVQLLPGNNNIQIFGQNESIQRLANPAAVWLMIKDDSNRILVKTDCTNWSTSPPAAPAPAAAAPAPAVPVYMPPQTLNLNRVKRTKTCDTCPSAPLLSSLPTPSIAHNVNLPHYCQRLTDDGGI